MIDKTASVPRNRTLPEALDFEKLLELGIQRAQEVSGDVWTDYNLHDPGVTILEQACFALVDIAYRASHPIQDLIDTVFLESADTAAMAGPRAKRMAIDFPLPHRALTTAPVTPADLRSQMADLFPALRGVWLRTKTVPFLPDNSELLALAVDVMSYNRVEDYTDAGKLSSWLQANRLIGQSVESPCFLGHAPYRFDAIIEARDGFDPDDLTAAVLDAVDYALCPPIRFKPLPDLGDRPPMDVLFDGPFLEHGLAAAWDVPREQPLCDDRWLRRVIAKVDGVAEIAKVTVYTTTAPEGHRLVIDRDDRKTARMVAITGRTGPAPGPLRMQSAENDEQITHVHNDLKYRMEKRRTQAEYARKRRLRELRADIPIGKRRRRLGEYKSIQYGFPEIYKLAPRATAESADPERDRNIVNLRGFLALLEQTLADMLHQIKLAPELLSAGEEFDAILERTYAANSLLLAESAYPVPDFKSLVREEAKYTTQIEKAAIDTDKRAHRQEDFLDHLLARYDESFENDELRQFEHATPEGHHCESGRRIQAKRRFLHEIVPLDPVAHAPAFRPGLTTHRGHIADSGGPDGCSAFARRVALKTLMDAPPVVLEHHILAGFEPSDSEREQLTNFVPRQDGGWLSVALRITPRKAPPFDVILHEAERAPRAVANRLEADPNARLARALTNATLVSSMDAQTGDSWNVWRAPDCSSVVVLLSPLLGARERAFAAFAALPSALNGSSVARILYPPDFGAGRITVVAKARDFGAAATEASAHELPDNMRQAHAALIRRTVDMELPVALEANVLSDTLWPAIFRTGSVLSDCKTPRAHVSFDSFHSDAAELSRKLALGPATLPKDLAPAAMRVLQTVTEAAYSAHCVALDRFLAHG